MDAVLIWCQSHQLHATCFSIKDSKIKEGSKERTKDGFFCKGNEITLNFNLCGSYVHAHFELQVFYHWPFQHFCYEAGILPVPRRGHSCVSLYTGRL